MTETHDEAERITREMHAKAKGIMEARAKKRFDRHREHGRKAEKADPLGGVYHTVAVIPLS